MDSRFWLGRSGQVKAYPLCGYQTKSVITKHDEGDEMTDKAMRICDNKGFHLDLPNGVTVSVQMVMSVWLTACP